MCSVASPDSSGDRDERSVRGPQTRKRHARRHLHPETLEYRRGLPVELAPVDPPGATGIRKPDEHVLGDAQVLEQSEILVNERERGGEAPLRGDVLGSDRFTADGDPSARVSWLDAGKDLDERRLARPVAPDQRADLARPYLERNV